MGASRLQHYSGIPNLPFSKYFHCSQGAALSSGQLMKLTPMASETALTCSCAERENEQIAPSPLPVTWTTASNYQYKVACSDPHAIQLHGSYTALLCEALARGKGQVWNAYLTQSEKRCVDQDIKFQTNIFALNGFD